MRKFLLICLSAFLIFLPSCASEQSDNVSIVSDDDSNECIDLFKTSFISEYYQSLGENKLQKLVNDSAIVGLRGINGTLLHTGTSTRTLFNYSTGQFQWVVMEYNKLTGDFTYACREKNCDHTSCLFLPQNRIYASSKHLFYVSDSSDKYFYIFDIDGNNPTEIKIPKDAVLHSETDIGIYWEKEEVYGNTTLYSLWLYEFSTGKSRNLTDAFKNVVFFVIGDTVYLQDTIEHTLYRFSDDYSDKKIVTNDISYITKFDGTLYDYNYETNVLSKLEGDTMITVAKTPSVHEYWVSEGYIYYICTDTTFINSESDEKKRLYLSEYNRTCGNIYRVKEKSDKHELVYQGTHDGIPDRIDNIYADGEVLYIQYRSYKNFPNNYSSDRGVTGLIIFDIGTKERIDISNECAR